MKGLVSLIMPVTSEEYAQDAIRSIFMQSYANWELLILVCGPLKKMTTIVNKFNDPRIKAIEVEANIGMVEAFAYGLKKSTGEYIIRHDPDDISLPKRLELQVDYLKEHINIGMVFCSIKAFTEDYRYKKQCENINMLQNIYRTKEDIDKGILAGNYPIIFPALMIRKNLFKNIDILYKKTGFEDELELVLNLLKSSSIEKIDDVLYYYRRHNNSYHSIRNIEFIKYKKNLLNDEELINSLRYREFRNELANIKIKKVEMNKSSIIRVLMLVDELNIGGTETYVLNLTKALVEKGVYVVIASVGGIFQDVFKLYGIKVIRISIKSKLNVIEEIKEIIASEGINLLHCHLNRSMELGKEIYKRYNIPYIITLHGMFYSKEILMSTCVKAKAIIAVSNPVKDLFLENMRVNFQGILRVIANGIDTETFKPDVEHSPIRDNLGIPKNVIVILYCSRLGYGKGVIAEDILATFKEISLKFKDIYFIVVGDGSKKESITGMAEKINLALNRKVIHVIGARYDMLSYYLESNIIIGTGRVALEALSCGKIVFAAGSKGYIGTVSEDNKQEMWNLYFGDHKGKEGTNNRDLTKSLECLIHSNEKTLKCDNWSREWCIKNFEVGKIAEEIIGLYKDILKINT